MTIRPREHEGLEELEEGGGRLLPAPLLRPRIITTVDQLHELVEFYSGVRAFSMDTETLGDSKEIKLDPWRNEVFWISLATRGRSDAIPMGHPHGRLLRRSRKVKVYPPLDERRELKNGKPSKAKVIRQLPDEFAPPPEQLKPSVVFEALRPLFWSDRTKVGQNFKFDVKTVAKYYNWEIMPGPFSETMVLAHLLDERRRQVNLAVLAHDILGVKDYPKLGAKGAENFSINAAARYACQDAMYTWQIHDVGMPQLREARLDRVYAMEMDLYEAVIDMEVAGALVDAESLDSLRADLHAQLVDLEAQIFTYNGNRAFNLNANADKIKFLFTPKREGGRGLKPLTYTAKTNQPQVDDATLQYYAPRDAAVGLMIEHSDVRKMVSTYADAWHELMGEDGRLHPDFGQDGARTGRLTCKKPNMQNVPRADTDLGKRVRRLVIASPGCELVVADYDQIELRVLAHYSKDPVMVRTFVNGEDIHAATTELLLGLERGSVPKKGDPRRQLGKNINFATSFGAGPGKIASMCKDSGYPLGETTEEAEEEAKRFLDLFEKRFPAIAQLKAEIVARAKSRRPPYVKTILGRVRRLPELFYDERKERAKAERQAVNTVIQGSAADIMKLAMIRVHDALEGSSAKPIITVHDELVIESPLLFVPECKSLVIEAMSGVTLNSKPILSVPLDVACDSAPRWSEAK